MSELLRWGAATDAGRVRDGNEDSFLAEPLVFAVADGMGGHQAGEVASEMAVDVLRQRLSEGAPSVDVVVAAVVEANAAIFQTARRNSAQMGMGTTITMLAVLPGGEPAPVGVTVEPAGEDDLIEAATAPVDTGGSHDTVPVADQPVGAATAAADGAPVEPPRLAIANVGDSRTYLLRAGELSRITVDHSYVQELLATGHLSEDEARNHPRRNIVTRALGIEPSVRVDSWALALVRGDRFVLCSDGLVDEIDDDAIGAIVRSVADPQAAAEQLVAAALDHGGRDNVTVVVVDVVLGAELLSATAAPEGHPSTMLMPAVGSSAVAADPIDAGAAPRRRRQLSTRTFLVLVAVAALLTVIVTFVAVAVSRNDAPAPTTTTPTTTPATTTPTTIPTTSSTEPGPSTTAGPEPTTNVTTTTVGGP